jgi:hypothetical protein
VHVIEISLIAAAPSDKFYAADCDLDISDNSDFSEMFKYSERSFGLRLK